MREVNISGERIYILYYILIILLLFHNIYMAIDNDNTLSIYTVNNQYGYRYNINHPKIRELYDRYTAWKHISGRPLTDAERREFEAYLDGIVRR